MRGFSQWGKSFSEIESLIIYYYEIFVKHSIRLVQKFKKLIVKTQGQEKRLNTTNQKIEVDAGCNPPGHHNVDNPFTDIFIKYHLTKLSSDMYPRQKLLQP